MLSGSAAIALRHMYAIRRFFLCDQYDHVADESYLEALNLFEQCPALRVPFWRSHVDGTATNSDIQVSSQS